MSAILAAALRGAGGLALVGVVILLIVLCLRHRRRTSDSSENSSSGPALPAIIGKEKRNCLMSWILKRKPRYGRARRLDKNRWTYLCVMLALPRRLDKSTMQTHSSLTETLKGNYMYLC